MRPKVLMSSLGQNIQRAHSRREFEDSLNTLNQLSQGNLSHNNLKTNPQPISWEEVAEDVESFLSQRKKTNGLNP